VDASGSKTDLRNIVIPSWNLGLAPN